MASFSFMSCTVTLPVPGFFPTILPLCVSLLSLRLSLLLRCSDTAKSLLFLVSSTSFFFPRSGWPFMMSSLPWSFWNLFGALCLRCFLSLCLLRASALPSLALRSYSSSSAAGSFPIKSAPNQFLDLLRQQVLSACHHLCAIPSYPYRLPSVYDPCPVNMDPSRSDVAPCVLELAWPAV
ncbi:hypothetical protein FN846DRAFT_141076 [Sphaerosporella brunnea]|uniref:Uncharacterized protein n=1 Tax=Sphaerosporella brunnea TaxID=1250544 RepID=A0A5J5ERK7_9PEZI|nr:hypothetical protein FN846DRAFT_141076 [Sphaerosporella brunnea]